MNPLNVELLRKIPSVDKILKDLKNLYSCAPVYLSQEVRKYLQNLREKIEQGEKVDISYSVLLEEIKEKIQKKVSPNVTRAINATGIVLHTGLGRAVLPVDAINALVKEISGYCVLEIDRETGKRSVRDIAIRDILCSLTQAQDATVVNNNAGAILLVLASLTRGKEVIVSRGQLVEIGGSFRVPEILAESGSELIEVGCTNCTHLRDYEKAISPKTGAILFVHTSNYQIQGFTQEVPLEDLADLARKKNILLLEDAGSGAMFDFSPWSLQGDPVVQESIQKGADVVSFSGDKLLGGCQAGFIIGKHDLIEKIRKHPLARALRVDKLTLCALESTLQIYREGNHLERIPALSMITAPLEIIQNRAEKIAFSLKANFPQIKISVVSSMCSPGSGSFPTKEIPSYAVCLELPSKLTILEILLRKNTPPVFARVHKNCLLIEPRTLLPHEDMEVLEILFHLLKKIFQEKEESFYA